MRIRDAKFIQMRYARVEFLLVVLVIGVVAAMQLYFYSAGVFKAKLFDPFQQLAAEKIRVTEAVALTGSLPVTEAVNPEGHRMGETKRARRIASARDLEEAHQSVARTAQMATDIEGFGLRKVKVTIAGSSVMGLSEGVPTAAISATFIDPPALLELRPAMAPVDAPVVIWLCGKQNPPAGMAAPMPREPAVPDAYLPFPCRTSL